MSSAKKAIRDQMRQMGSLGVNINGLALFIICMGAMLAKEGLVCRKNVPPESAACGPSAERTMVFYFFAQ